MIHRDVHILYEISVVSFRPVIKQAELGMKKSLRGG